MEGFENLVVDLRKGNVHIRVKGQFTTDTAEALISAMVDSYPGTGNIFIHTTELTEIVQESKRFFGILLGSSGLPRGNIYLIGKKGMDIGQDGVKVIVYEKREHGCGCSGKCKGCTCHKKMAA